MRRRQWLGLAALGTLGGGCAMVPPPTRPVMERLSLPSPCPGRADALLVMLPGAYSRPPEFVEAGFPAALAASRATADIVIADSHLGYFYDKSVLRQLREHIVVPARATGYRRIWLVGISLGGFAALGYAVRHPEDIDGVLALAPYLGPRRLMMEIGDAGGPRAWRHTRAAPGDDDLDREIWHAFAAQPPSMPVYLGYGVDDRFAASHREFATLLPAERVSTAPGGHDWPAWHALWQGWLARGLLADRCAARSS